MNEAISSPEPRWHAPAVLAGVTLVVFLNYGLRVDDLPLRGEESRWGQVAREMLRSGDWVVPRQQGEPFLSRPPLHAWTIAASAAALGRFDTLTVRLPSILAVEITVLMIVLYSRRFVSWFAAGFAGVAYATMGAVLQNARLGETEAVFTALVASSLLAWHAGYCRGWSPAIAWSLGYGFAALGTLAKGPQAPCYFLAPVALYLFFRRDWRWLRSWGHVLGIAVYLAILLAWLVPLHGAVGEAGVRAVFTGDVALHVAERTTVDAATHMSTFLAETLGVLLPWSLLLLAYAFAGVRHRAMALGPVWLFLAVVIAVTYPTCLFVPGAKTRYYMSMFPILAAWLAPLIELLLTADPATARLRRGWRIALGLAAVTAVAIVGGLVYASVGGSPAVAGFGQPAGAVVLFAALALAVAGGWIVAGRAIDRRRATIALAGFVLLPSLASTWIGTDQQARRAPAVAAEVAALKARLAPGDALTSYGPVHHLFAYEFGDPIALHPATAPPQVLPAVFCYQVAGDLRYPLPFAVTELAAISMDRVRRDPPGIVVVVVRRVP